MGKTLFLYTSTYPYGNGESFIENEISYLSNAYTYIYIICSNTYDKQTREVPSNVILIRKSIHLTTYQKICCLWGIFNPIVLKEFLFKTLFSFSRTFILLQSYYRGKMICKHTSLLVKLNHINLDRLNLYTYWWLDEAIGICLFKSKNKQVKAFTRAHRYDLYFYTNPYHYLPLKQYTSQCLDKIYPISEDGKSYIFSHMHIKNTEVHKLGTPKAVDFVSNIEPQKRLLLISCAKIYPNKNIIKIAEALYKLSHISIEWVHFGDYIKNYSDIYYRDLIDLTEKLKKLHPINIIFKGDVSNAQILDFYKNEKPDLFINLSDSEGIPVSIMEAMSYGVPCIATAVGGTPEIVKHKYNGFLLPINTTSEEVAKTISYFYSLVDKEKTLLRENAYHTWNTEYNADKNYPQFIHAISHL